MGIGTVEAVASGQYDEEYLRETETLPISGNFPFQEIISTYFQGGKREGKMGMGKAEEGKREKRKRPALRAKPVSPPGDH